MLKLEWLKKISPDFFIASGGYKMKVESFSDTTSNGLTKSIMAFLKYSGHHCTRVNTQGQARIQRIPRFSIFTRRVEHTEKVHYTKSTTAKGTADLHAIINGRAASIEVKVDKDIQSDDQKKEQQRVESAGGLYVIARNFPDWREWYRQNFE